PPRGQLYYCFGVGIGIKSKKIIMSKENLNNQEAVEKLKKLVDSIDICLFCTDVNNGKMNVAPMSRQEVDENGNIWFLAHVESHTCKNIEKDENVVLNFANASNY